MSNEQFPVEIESVDPGVKGSRQPHMLVVPPYVAANICKMLERVTVTGMEAIAWSEAYQIMQQIAAPFIAAQGHASGTGAPFRGIGS